MTDRSDLASSQALQQSLYTDVDGWGMTVQQLIRKELEALDEQAPINPEPPAPTSAPAPAEADAEIESSASTPVEATDPRQAD